MISALSAREWIGVVLLPGLTLLAKYVMDTRQQDQSRRTAASTDWRGDFDAIRGEWKEIRESWSIRIEQAEAGERDCEQRCADLLVRMNEMETQLKGCHREIHSQREELQVLQLESDLRKRRTPNENGDPT